MFPVFLFRHFINLPVCQHFMISVGNIRSDSLLSPMFHPVQDSRFQVKSINQKKLFLFKTQYEIKQIRNMKRDNIIIKLLLGEM